MRALKFTWIFLLLLCNSCGLFSGRIRYGTYRVILMKNNPPTYAIQSDGTCGNSLGIFKGNIGDTVLAKGVHIGGLIELPHYLVASDSSDVYLNDPDVLWEDDYLYSNLGSSFQLSTAADPTAWGRATLYVSTRTDAHIEVASDNLIQTRHSKADSVVSYSIVRIPNGQMVQYQITCECRKKNFNPEYPAKQLAFYMSTGREYARLY